MTMFRSIVLIAVFIVVFGVGLARAADHPAYTMDTDPIRLGNQAFAAGQLDEARARYQEAIAADYHLDAAHLGLAWVQARLGKYQAALADYQQALAAGGAQPEAHAGMGLILLRLGDSARAREQFEKALAVDKKLFAAHYGLALLAIAAKDWDAARAQLERGKRPKGEPALEARYHHAQALILQGTGDSDAALTEALRASTLDPTDPDFVTLVAQLYAAQGTASLALSTYEQALATPGMQPTASLLDEMGRLYEKQQLYNEASAHYLQAVQLDSTYAPALKDLADLYQRADRDELAARTALRYVALVPDNVAMWEQLANIMGNLGRWHESLDAARHARELAPDSETARFAFARAGLHGDDATAKNEAAQVMAALPDSLPWEADDLVQLAAWQAQEKNWSAARATLARAAAMAPDLAAVPFQQGLVELKAGRADAAVPFFQRAVVLGPDSPANQLNLGIAYYQAGKIRDAIAPFRRAVALRDDLTMGRLLLAQALAVSDSLTAAQHEYTLVLAQDPENTKALRGLGFCQLRGARYQAAADAYKEAAEAEPDNADAWAGLGSAYLGLGRLEDAERAFTKARAIDPRNVMLVKGTELLNQARTAGKE